MTRSSCSSCGAAGTRLAEAQVNFTGGSYWRNYFIIHRPAQWVGNGRGGKLRPGRWCCLTITHPEDARRGLPFNTEDLRDPTEAECVRRYLELYPRRAVEELLCKMGQPVP